MMGTTINLSVAHQEADNILNKIISRLKIYEQRFSANDSTSELSEINQKAGIIPVIVHPELYELIKIGKKHSLPENSQLNIAIGPLIQSWRIGFDDARVPDNYEIQETLKIINPENIILDDKEKSVFLTEKDMAIDLGSLAKGYIADKICDYLDEVGSPSALINLGGNLAAHGTSLKNSDGMWHIGVQNPFYTRGNSQFVLKVQNKSVVTSGIYERNLHQNGETFHHIFDSHTGYPVKTNVVSLTIVSNLSIEGEIWTTRLFGLTAHQIIDSLNRMNDIEGLVIFNDGSFIFSNGFSEYLV